MARTRIRVPAGSSRRAPTAWLPDRAPGSVSDVARGATRAWTPWRGEVEDDLRRVRADVTARARDLVAGNALAASAVRRETDAVVGASLRPCAAPDWRALGIDEGDGARVAAEMDAAWALWADDPLARCDATRVQGWGGLCELAYRTAYVDGDAFALLVDAPDGPGGIGVAVQLIDPDMIATPTGMRDGPALRSGIALDAGGAPIGYWVHRSHPRAIGGDRLPPALVSRLDGDGLPQLIHWYERLRPTQVRGISRYAPVIDDLYMLGSYRRAELEASVLAAVLGLYLSTPLDPEMAGDLLSDGGAGYLALDAAQSALAESKDLRFAGTRIPVVPPGTDLKSVASARPSTQFGTFTAAGARSVAAGLATGYEEMTADFSETTYSSARATANVVWRGFAQRRSSFARRFADPVRHAVIAAAIDAGLVTLPATAPPLDAAPGPWLRARWQGPGRGFVDPVKEVAGSVARIAAGLSTLERETAELTGGDVASTLDQIAREIPRMPPGTLHPAQQDFARLVGAPDQPQPQETPSP